MMQNCKDLLDKGTNQPQSILMIAIRDVEWMHTVSLCIFFGWVFPDRDREGGRHFRTPSNTIEAYSITWSLQEISHPKT